MLPFQIELRPLIGTFHDRRVGDRQVEHPIWLLMYHDAEVERTRNNPWLHIGMVGWHTESIEFLPQAVPLGNEVLDAVTAEVEKQTGSKRIQHLPPKPIGTSRPAVRDLDEE